MTVPIDEQIAAVERAIRATEKGLLMLIAEPVRSAGAHQINGLRAALATLRAVKAEWEAKVPFSMDTPFDAPLRKKP